MSMALPVTMIARPPWRRTAARPAGVSDSRTRLVPADSMWTVPRAMVTSGPPFFGRAIARSETGPGSLISTRTTSLWVRRSTWTWREATRTTSVGLTWSFDDDGDVEFCDEPGRAAGVPLVVTWIVPFMLGWIEQMKS